MTEDLTLFESYVIPPDQKHEPIPLNVVVVKTWNNQTPPVDKQVVFVTNGEVKDTFIAFDRYDDRSLMENNRNR